MRKALSVCHLSAWALALLVGVTSTAQAYTTGNLLSNDGFDTAGLLANFADTLGPPFTQNAWGAELGSIVGATAGVFPAGGPFMLEEQPTGAATQTMQLIDVSAYAVDINANLVTADMSAYFNVPDQLVGVVPVAGVSLTFYDGLHAVLGGGQQNINVDAFAATWELDLMAGTPVPANTQFILAQVFYGSVSLNGGNGYVDSTQLTLTAVPEPSSLALLGIGLAGLVGGLRLRRKR